MRRKKRKTGKTLFTILIVAALCVAGAFVYEYFIAERPEKKVETAEKVEAKTEKQPEKTQPKTEEKEDGKVIGKDPVVQYEGEDPNKSETLTGAITYAGVSGQNLIIRLSINQYLNSGNCNLSLVKDGSELYSASANIFADVSTSTCQGFNVATNNLPSGSYSIIVKLSSGDKTGTITGSVNL